jgi:hypothetical protein
MEPLIIEILRAGVSVVMDFAGNTVYERSWVRSLFEAAGADALNDLKTSSFSLRISRNGCLRNTLLQRHTAETSRPEPARLHAYSKDECESNPAAKGTYFFNKFLD